MQPDLWNAHDLRTTFPGSPHKDVDDILVRFQSLTEAYTVDTIRDAHETVWFPAISQLPEIRPLIFSLMAAVQGERLGRVIITRLAPGKKIYAHVDSGLPAEYFQRFQICLKNGPGSLFRCGEETVCFAAGETWWFNNQLEHEVVNNSREDRLVMIVDIRRGKYSRGEAL
jgi:hypothetical protein